MFTCFISIIAWYAYTRHLDLEIAYKGFSPYEWIVMKHHPYITAIGYPSGMEIYRSSLFFKLYAFADFLGMDTIATMKAVIATELLATYIGVRLFADALFPSLETNYKNLLVFALYLYFIASYALFPEISRFGSAFNTGLYYNIANAFRLMALAFFLTRKFIWAGLLLSLTFLVHPIYGLIGGIFMLGALAVIINDIDNNEKKKIGLALSIFVSVGVLWYLYTFGIHRDSSLQIPNSAWYFYSVFSNYHWFPIEFGLLSEAHQERLIGFLIVSLLYLYSLSKKETLTSIDKQVFFGWVVLIVVTVVGLIVSWYKPSPFLTKMALTRASLLALEIGIFYIVYRFVCGLFDKRSPWYLRVLVATLWVMPFLIQAPFALYPVILLIAADYLRSKTTNSFTKPTIILTLSILLLTVYFYTSGYIRIDWNKFAHIGNIDHYLKSSQYDRYLGNLTILVILIAFSAMFYVVDKAKRIGFLFFFVPFILSVSAFVHLYLATPNETYINRAKAFKNVQLWAKRHTPKEALFMLDSAMSYGWRAFSERASFGTLREWIHVAWLYNSDYRTYREGLQRFGEFGIDIESPKYHVAPRLKQFKLLRKDIRERFYSFDEAWFRRMARKYGIDYIVMRNRYIKHPLRFEKVYNNDYFTVFKVDK